ncbi:MAG: hypothetical protein AAGU27_11470, partial [Dehalobacterium sp.]
SQSIDFISPVRIDDSIKITGKVTGQDHTNALGLNIIVIKREITNQLGRKVARGTVKVSTK